MANWFYYSQDGSKIGVSSVEELKHRAKLGMIRPDTVIENEEGNQAPAGRVNGLIFSDTLSIDDEEVAPSITEMDWTSPSTEPIPPIKIEVNPTPIDTAPKATFTDILISTFMILVAIIIAGCILWYAVAIIEFVGYKTGLSAEFVRLIGIVIGIGGIIAGTIGFGSIIDDKPEMNVTVEIGASVVIGLFVIVMGLMVWAVRDVVEFVAFKTELAVWFIYPVGIIIGSILPIWSISDEVKKKTERNYVTLATDVAPSAIIVLSITISITFFVMGLLVWTGSSLLGWAGSAWIESANRTSTTSTVMWWVIPMIWIILLVIRGMWNSRKSVTAEIVRMKVKSMTAKQRCSGIGGIFIAIGIVLLCISWKMDSHNEGLIADYDYAVRTNQNIAQRLNNDSRNLSYEQMGQRLNDGWAAVVETGKADLRLRSDSHSPALIGLLFLGGGFLLLSGFILTVVGWCIPE
jgi:hypothetical protein